MKKIISLFKRDFVKNPKLVTREVTEGAEWVIAGEGMPTRKWDGTACLVKDGKLYARYDAKNGKTPPIGSIPCQPEPDPLTTHWPHWVEVEDQPQFKWHKKAYDEILPDGTYELVGPHFQTNPEKMERDCFIFHGFSPFPLGEVPRTFDGLRTWFDTHPIEGIVWHNPDGRMVKIKRSDFGLEWPVI